MPETTAAEDWSAFEPKDTGETVGQPAPTSDNTNHPAPIQPYPSDNTINGEDWSAFNPSSVSPDQVQGAPAAFQAQLTAGVAASKDQSSWTDDLKAIWNAAKEGNAVGYNAEAMADYHQHNSEEIDKLADNAWEYRAFKTLQPLVEATASYYQTVTKALPAAAGAVAGETAALIAGKSPEEQADWRDTGIKTAMRSWDDLQLAGLGAGLAGVEFGAGTGPSAWLPEAPVAPAIPMKNGDFARMHPRADGTIGATPIGKVPMPEDYSRAAQSIHASKPTTVVIHPKAYYTQETQAHIDQVVQGAVAAAKNRAVVETPMPSGANSTTKLDGPVYVDPSVPENLRGPVKVHETVEQALMSDPTLKMSYEEAHEIATREERRAVEDSGQNWEEYTHEWDGVLSHVEKEQVQSDNLPRDLHVNPTTATSHHSSAEKQAPERQGPGDLATTEKKLVELWKEKGVHPAEVARAAQQDPLIAHDLSSAAAVPDTLPDANPFVPSQPPGRLTAIMHGLSEKYYDTKRTFQQAVTPMALGSDSTRAMAKDWANLNRRISWQQINRLAEVDRRFSPEQQNRMWQALDEESRMRAEGANPDEYAGEYGLSTLTPDERAFVEHEIVDRQNILWQHAKDLGVVKPDAPGIPFYAARIASRTGAGERSHVHMDQLGDRIGLNLNTKTGRLKKRKYATVEETEEALQKIPGFEKAHIVRNIKANVAAAYQLEKAVAARKFVNDLEAFNKANGADVVARGFKPAEGWFAIDHPDLMAWVPDLQKIVDADGSTSYQAVRNPDGTTHFKKVPMYFHPDLRGPLTAVLSGKPSLLMRAWNAAKSASMSIIMFSPMLHNSVIFSKGVAAFKGNIPATVRAYFTGHSIRNDNFRMAEAIEGGLVPVGRTFFKQELSDALTAPDLTPGASLSAKVAGFIPGLFDENAGAAVTAAIDKAWNVHDNTLLWDRVADLQMGVFDRMRAEAEAAGIPHQVAVRMAAREANNIAGSLPRESMSQAARSLGNVLLFSRSFTVSNWSIMADLARGMDKATLALVKRDAERLGMDGEMMGKTAKAMSRRQAAAMVITDLVLFHAGYSVLQSAIDVMLGRDTTTDEAKSYWTRFKKELSVNWSNPWWLALPIGIFHFIHGISTLSENEPTRQDKVLLGYDKDGTGIYIRPMVGRMGDEFTEYMSGYWLDMFRRKMGTIVRPALDLLENDKGFGRKIYDPDIHTPTQALSAAWNIAGYFVEQSSGLTSLAAGYHLLRGEGNFETNLAQTIGPWLPPPFTFTASKGAPGGPAIGEMYAAREAHDFRVQQAMPGIRQLITDGKLDEAVHLMQDLKISRGLQRWYIKTTLNPALRASPRALQEFYEIATPEERERFLNYGGARQ